MIVDEAQNLTPRAVEEAGTVALERGAALRLLETVYGVAPDKIDVIPHGVIDMPFIDSNFYKDLFGVEGKSVLLSFGLLSANKGIENVIAALPANDMLEEPTVAGPGFINFFLTGDAVTAVVTAMPAARPKAVLRMPVLVLSAA